MCLLLSVFYLFLYLYITLYYFLQFSNIIIHTHVTWLASAYYCFCFVCFLLCLLKRELVFCVSLFFATLFVGFLFSYLNYQRRASFSSLLLFCFPSSLSSVSRSRSLAIARPSFSFFLHHHHHHYHAASSSSCSSSLSEAAFLSVACPPLRPVA